MKKIYKIILLLQIISFVSSAQPYHKFLDSDGWYERTDDFTGTFYYWYYKAGDTLINSNSYKKIHTLPAYANYFVREDTINKKVYIKYSPVAAEILLYDFNLTVGDSFLILGNINAVVDSINIVILSCGSRNRFYVTTSPFLYHTQYIEGVGSIDDPLRFLNPVTDPVYTLVCNYEANAVCYQWPLDTCPANPFIGISDFSYSDNYKGHFSPNPLTTQSKLTFKNPTKEKFLFTLYDITGRVTESVSTTNNEIILTKGSKPAGVYLFNLMNTESSQIINGKIIITN